MPRLVLALIPFLCLAQESNFSKIAQQTMARAEQLYNQKEYGKAAALLEDLRRNPAFARLEDERASALYDLACNYSLAGEKEKAIATLRDAFLAGYTDASHIQQDHDIDQIRDDPAYRKLYSEIEARQRAQRDFWYGPALRAAYRDDLSEDLRIAGLSRLWSEAKYNFAFFDRLPGLDWDGLYLSYLPKVRAAKSTREYYETLSDFYAQLHDGHTGVSFPRQVSEQYGYAGVSTRLVEDRVFIDAVRDPALEEQGIRRGMEVVAIDGIPVKEYGKSRIAAHVGASTPQDLEQRVYEARLLGGLKDTSLELTLDDDAGAASKKMLPRLTEAQRSKFPRMPWKRLEFKMLAGSVAYVAINTMGDDGVVKDFEAAWPEIEKSSSLILDVRENGGGSSGTGYAVLAYLTDRPFLDSRACTRDYRPTFRAWGRNEKLYCMEPDGIQPRSSKPYTKPVAVLTSARTFSAAEDFAVAFDGMKRGKIVGEATGGSTGQPLSFPLPGGGSARVCTKHDTYPDGKEFVGVGVQPNIVVHPTIADFRSDRDTVLEAALRVVTGM
jgi:C-terminal processing protease CtpA/Prc